MIYNGNEMNMRRSCFLSLLSVLIYVFCSTDPVSAMQIKPLTTGDEKNLYQVTCDNGKQHTIIADHAEQDFQYYYPGKDYYIKYYDMEFKSNYDFAEWVCRNK